LKKRGRFVFYPKNLIFDFETNPFSSTSFSYPIIFPMNTRFFLTGMVIGLILIFSGCSKPRKNDFFKIKYEIITTAEVTDPFPIIVTRAGLELPGSHTNFRSGKTWSYATDFETSYRPVEVFLNGQNMRLKDAGKVTLNIYINNSLKATSTRETAIFDGKHTVTTGPIGYVIR